LDTGVLGKGRSSHIVEDVLAAGTETGGAVRHLSFALGQTDLAAQVGFSALFMSWGSWERQHLAELALSTFRGVERNDMVADLDIGDALADRLDNSASLVAADDREGTLGVFAREGVGIGVADLAD